MESGNQQNLATDHQWCKGMYTSLRKWYQTLPPGPTSVPTVATSKVVLWIEAQKTSLEGLLNGASSANAAKAKATKVGRYQGFLCKVVDCLELLRQVHDCLRAVRGLAPLLSAEHLKLLNELSTREDTMWDSFRDKYTKAPLFSGFMLLDTSKNALKQFVDLEALLKPASEEIYDGAKHLLVQGLRKRYIGNSRGACGVIFLLAQNNVIKLAEHYQQLDPKHAELPSIPLMARGLNNCYQQEDLEGLVTDWIAKVHDLYSMGIQPTLRAEITIPASLSHRQIRHYPNSQLARRLQCL